MRALVDYSPKQHGFRAWRSISDAFEEVVQKMKMDEAYKCYFLRIFRNYSKDHTLIPDELDTLMMCHNRRLNKFSAHWKW